MAKTHEMLDENGLFAKGNSGGPGRPRGSGKLCISTLCRTKANNEGLDVTDLVWGMMKGLMVKGSQGNAKCAALVLEHLAILPDKGPAVEIEIDARQVNTGTGPALPAGPDLVALLGKVTRLNDELHVASGPKLAKAVDDVIGDMLK